MNEPKMPAEIDTKFREAESRFIRDLVALLDRHPQFRKSFAYGRLGGAVAFADKMGCDVEGFLAHLRATQEKPPVLVPRKS